MTLEVADVFECVQERILHRVLSFLRVTEDCYLYAIKRAGVAANQFFEGIQIAALRSGHEDSIRVLNCHLGLRECGHMFRGLREKMHLFRSKTNGELKVRCDTQPHLNRIEEIGEAGHYHTFQNLLLGETMSSNPIYVLTTKLGSTYSKFECKIK